MIKSLKIGLTNIGSERITVSFLPKWSPFVHITCIWHMVSKTYKGQRHLPIDSFLAYLNVRKVTQWDNTLTRSVGNFWG